MSALRRWRRWGSRRVPTPWPQGSCCARRRPHRVPWLCYVLGSVPKSTRLLETLIHSSNISEGVTWQPTRRYSPEETEAGPPTVPFTAARKCKQPSCPLMDGWINKMCYTYAIEGLPRQFSGKEPVCNSGDEGLTPGLGRPPGEGSGSPLQYSFLENLMERGA